MRQQLGKGSFVILAYFVLAHYAHHLATALLTPLLPFIRDAFNLDYLQVGFLISAFSVFYGMSQLPAGALADWVSKRALIATGALIVGLATLSIAITRQYYLLITALILMGLFGGTYHAPASALLSQYFGKEIRGRALGLHIVGGSLGFLSGPFLGALIARSSLGWRAAFGILSLPLLAMGFLIYLVVKSEAPSQATTVFSKAYWRDVAQGLGLVGLLVGVSVVFQASTMALISFLPLYLTDARGVEPYLAAIMFGSIFAAGIVGAPAGGFLSDRIGRSWIILASAILTGPILLLITVAPAGIPIVLAFMALGLVLQSRGPVTESLINDTIPLSQRSAFLGLYFFFNIEAGGILAPLLGALIQRFGLSSSFTAVALTTCVMSLVLLAMAGKIHASVARLPA